MRLFRGHDVSMFATCVGDRVAMRSYPPGDTAYRFRHSAIQLASTLSSFCHYCLNQLIVIIASLWLFCSASGWLVSGSVCAIISLRKGYTTVLPFSPNRLPRKRDFTICLSPLRTTSCTAIAALEKSLRSGHNIKDPQLSTYLRIYEADISSKFHTLVPTQLGGCQIHLNTTARQLVELRPLTDDVTQKQILATPTFAFSTYRKVPVD